MRQKNKQIILVGLFLFFAFFASGCSNRTELEDRDFVMALGIEAIGENYRFTYQMPNFGASTGQEEKETGQGIVTLEGVSMAEIEEKFAIQSEKRLDYNHMKAIILHDELTKKEGQIQRLLTQFQEKQEFGRNTYLYLTEVSPEKLLREGKEEEDLGSYLEKLRGNKDLGRTNRQMTIGNYITCSNNKGQSITIPSLSLENGSVLQTGGGIIQGATLRKKIVEEEYQLMDLIYGKGSGWQLAIDKEHQLIINRLVISEHFVEENGIPIYSLIVEGRADILSGEDWDMEEYNQRLASLLQSQFLSYGKKEQIDFLNLYRRCGVKNKKLWMKYKGKEEAYLDDIQLKVICSLQ